MKTKSKYLIGCKTGSQKYWTFVELDDMIHLLKNKRIIEYWESHCIKCSANKKYNIEDIYQLNNETQNYRIFAKQNIDEIFRLFCTLMIISLDGDPDECVNSLDAIERKRMNKTQFEQWLNGDIQFSKLNNTNKKKAILDYITSRKCISDPAMLDYIHEIINLKEKRSKNDQK